MRKVLLVLVTVGVGYFLYLRFVADRDADSGWISATD